VEISHTPPLGYVALTPFYDRVIAVMTRETAWRALLVKHLDAQPGEGILDVGAGTGSLAIAVTAAEPGCRYRGIDPDVGALTIARRKAADARSTATFQFGGLQPRPDRKDQPVDKVVCSLVLHQVPIEEKRRLLGAMFEWLRPGGRLLIADYGLQPTRAMRLAFRATVQLIDGKDDTQPNADGILPRLIQEAGFQDVEMLDGVNTSTGRIDIIGAKKPAVLVQQWRSAHAPSAATRPPDGAV